VDPDAVRLLLAATGPTATLASSATWPLIALGVAAVTALALWGLFRRGSIADRARADYGDDADPGSPGATDD
jgi:hypothetical protein